MGFASVGPAMPLGEHSSSQRKKGVVINLTRLSELDTAVHGRSEPLVTADLLFQVWCHSR
jgi:hypothetical protein